MIHFDTRRAPNFFPKNSMRASLVGFLAGAALPEAAGIYLLAHDIAYNASLPLGPNEARCGMPALGAWAMVLFVGPLSGIAGATIGLFGSMLLKAAEGWRA